nr:hypothetical protein [Nostoc sp. DedSLP05]
MLGTVSWKVIDLRDKINNLATPSGMTGASPLQPRNLWFLAEESP